MKLKLSGQEALLVTSALANEYMSLLKQMYNAGGGPTSSRPRVEPLHVDAIREQLDSIERICLDLARPITSVSARETVEAHYAMQVKIWLAGDPRKVK